MYDIYNLQMFGTLAPRYNTVKVSASNMSIMER